MISVKCKIKINWKDIYELYSCQNHVLSKQNKRAKQNFGLFLFFGNWKPAKCQ